MDSTYCQYSLLDFLWIFFLISFILIEVGGNGFCNFVLELSFTLGRGGKPATTSLEFEYLHRKSWYEMLIGGDDSSIWRHYPWCVLSRNFNVCLHSRSFPLHADWRKSDSSVDEEPQGNWRSNSNSRDVAASFPSFSRQNAPETLLAGLPSPCTAFSQSLSVNSLRWRIRVERAGNASRFRLDHATRNALASRNNEA